VQNAPWSEGEEQAVACYLWDDGEWLPAWLVDALQRPQLPTPGIISEEMLSEPSRALPDAGTEQTGQTG
jgi:hypothetical protein